MQTLKLLSAFFKVNVQMSLAYRADTVVNILLNLMWLGWELLSLNIIFSNTETIGGWGFGELIALLGVFRLVHTLMIALIWPNTEKFNQSIRDGSMDYTLLQPINSMFLVTFSRITVWRIWDLILAIVLITVGINISGDTVTPLNILTFILLTVSGAVVIYSLWIVLIALTFWFTKFDNNVTILQALLPQNISVQLLTAMLENQAGFFASQMTAMDNATRNAGDMIKALTIQMNRTRQAQITKELIEIISGAAAV